MADARVRTLILGSFPSAASLAARQYYAHPRNQFWPILSAVLAQPLVELPYAERLERLLAHAIGLWDVIDACERKGSLDTAIRNAQRSDVTGLLGAMPWLERVLLNGKLAGRAAPWFEAAGVTANVVPSTSPALATLSLTDKVALWRRALPDAQRKVGGTVSGRST